MLLPYLASIYLQSKAKLKKSLKLLLIVLKYKYCFKIKKTIRPDKVKTLISKTGFANILLSVSFLSFSVDSAMSFIMVNVLET